MKITSLGYNPINKTGQSYKNNNTKQYNTPAFQGRIIVDGHDLEGIENTLSYLEVLVRCFVTKFNIALKDSELVRESNSLSFPKRADAAAKAASDLLGVAYAERDLHHVNIRCEKSTE